MGFANQIGGTGSGENTGTSGAAQQLINNTQYITQNYQNYANSVVSTVYNGMSSVYNYLQGSYNTVTGAVNYGYNNVFSNVGNITAPIINEIVPKIIGVANYVSDTKSAIAQAVTNSVSTLSNNFTGLQNQIHTWLTTIQNNIDKNTSGAYSQVVNGINNGISSTVESVNNTLNEIRNKIATQVNTVSSAANNLTSQLKTTIDNTRNTIVGAVDVTLQRTANTIVNSTNSILDKVRTVAEEIKANSNAAANLAKSTINIVENEVRNNIAKGIGETLGAIKSTENVVKSAVSMVSKDVEKALQTQSTILGGILKETADDIKKAAKEGLELAEKIIEPLIKGIKGMIEEFFESLKPYAEHMHSKNPSPVYYLLTGKYQDIDEFWDDIAKQNSFTPIIQALSGFVIGMGAFMKIIMTTPDPFVRRFVQYSEQTARSNLYSPDVYVRMFHRELIDINDLRAILGKMGFSDRDTNFFKTTLIPVFSIGMLQTMFNRGIIDEFFVDTELKYAGYEKVQIDRIKKGFVVIPPVSDMIHFAVREVYNDDIINKFGLNDQFPEEFANQAKLQGMERETALQYWRAHWDLPSLSAGFDMFHRNIITRNELETLLVTQDIMPFWRPKLVQLAYNPITRVDVRRMYSMGVLTEEDVYRRYLDIGYSPEDARLMTRFTVLYESDIETPEKQEMKALSRSLVEKAFMIGALPESEALARLQDLGYSNQDANLLLYMKQYQNEVDVLRKRQENLEDRYEQLVIKAYTRRLYPRHLAQQVLTDMGSDNVLADVELDFADMEFDLNIKQEVLDRVRDMYLENTMTQLEVRALLENQGFLSEEIDHLFKELQPLKDIRVRKPTLAQLTTFYLNGILNTDEYYNEILGIGYHQKYAAMYILLLFQQDKAPLTEEELVYYVTQSGFNTES